MSKLIKPGAPAELVVPSIGIIKPGRMLPMPTATKSSATGEWTATVYTWYDGPTYWNFPALQYTPPCDCYCIVGAHQQGECWGTAWTFRIVEVGSGYQLTVPGWLHSNVQGLYSGAHVSIPYGPLYGGTTYTFRVDVITGATGTMKAYGDNTYGASILWLLPWTAP